MALNAQTYPEHIRVEDTKVLPLAEAMIVASDWAELDDAFWAHRDLLPGCDPEAAYQKLFRKVLAALPPSSGVGPALEALAGASPPKAPWPP